MVKYYRAVVIAKALFAGVLCQAQPNDLGTWNIANLRLSLNKKWAAWTELQLRSYKIYENFYYHEVKGGFQYNINNTTTTLLGIGQYVTYATDGNFKSPVGTHEFRTWEQITLINNIDRLKLEHRYRLEQRWLTQGYRNRFRYRLNAILPVNSNKMTKRTFYFTVFDEIFLTNTQPHFERNRFFAGTGYMFAKAFTLQCGLIYQSDYRADGTTFHKSFVQTSFLFDFYYRNHHTEQHPSVVD